MNERVAKNLVQKVAKKLGGYTVIQTEVRSNRDSGLTSGWRQYGLYAPGIATYNWKYFESFEALKAFAKEILEKGVPTSDNTRNS